MQGINVSLIGKSLAVCGELRTTRCGECQDGNDNALVNGKVRAIVFEVILEDDDCGRVDAARAGRTRLAPRVKFGIKGGKERAGIAQGFFLRRRRWASQLSCQVVSHTERHVPELSSK